MSEMMERIEGGREASIVETASETHEYNRLREYFEEEFRYSREGERVIRMDTDAGTRYLVTFIFDSDPDNAHAEIDIGLMNPEGNAQVVSARSTIDYYEEDQIVETSTFQVADDEIVATN